MVAGAMLYVDGLTPENSTKNPAFPALSTIVVFPIFVWEARPSSSLRQGFRRRQGDGETRRPDKQGTRLQKMAFNGCWL